LELVCVLAQLINFITISLGLVKLVHKNVQLVGEEILMNAFHAILAGFSTMRETPAQICSPVEMDFEIPGKTAMMQILKTGMDAISTVKLKLVGLAQVEI